MSLRGLVGPFAESGEAGITGSESMKGYTEIRSAEEGEAFLDRFGGFGDGLVKELHLHSSAFVDANGLMAMNPRIDVHVLLQAQGAPCAIELIFVDACNLRVGDDLECSYATIELDDARPFCCRRINFDCDSAFSVMAQRLFWRERPEWLGPAARLGGEIPLPDAADAHELEGEWRQCSACCDAFECPIETRFARCPRCHALTEFTPAE